MNTIRRIRPGESALYRSVRLRALKEDPYAFCATHESALQRSDEEWRDQADRAAEGSSQAIFIAFRNEDPIGLSAVCKDKEDGEIAEVFQVWIRPDARGAGLGTQMMDAVFGWALDSGCRIVVATIADSNGKAIGFYKNYGFEQEFQFGGETKMTKRARPDKSAVSTPASLRAASN